MMKEGSDETYPHHSDDTVHDDQADQIQETVDSGKIVTSYYPFNLLLLGLDGL